MLVIAATPPVPALATSGFILALDEVQDPGNVGTLIRTAAATGVDQVVIARLCGLRGVSRHCGPLRAQYFHTQVVEAVELQQALAAFSGQRWATLPRNIGGVKVTSILM